MRHANIILKLHGKGELIKWGTTLIGELIKCKSKGQKCPTRIMRNNKIFSTKYDISNQFNEHFVNVRPKLAESIDSTNVNPTDYIHNSSLSSLFMSPFTENH